MFSEFLCRLGTLEFESGVWGGGMLECVVLVYGLWFVGRDGDGVCGWV